MKNLFLSVCLLLLVPSARAQSSIQLSTGKLSIPPVSGFNSTLFWKQQAPVSGKHFAVLQFSKPLSPLQKQQLNGAGIELLGFIPPFSYNVSFTRETPKSILQQAGVTGITYMPASLKLSRTLQQPEKFNWIQGVNGRMDVLIKISTGISIAAAKQYLQEKGFALASSPFEDYHILQSHALSASLLDLAAIPFVEYIEPVHPADKALNNRSRDMARNNIASAPIAAGGYDLLGKNVTVGVGDEGDPTNHIDLQGHVINRNPFFPTEHGTHVTGTVGGAGIFRYLSRGYAPLATIVSQLYGGIYLNAGTYVNDYGMVLTNNSYGSVTGDSTYEGVYDLYSQILDQQAFQFPELLHVFASGNDGEVLVPPYVFNHANVLSGYQTAKNVISVGRTDRTMYASGSSSSGPVKDGRLKPELMALGEEIISPSSTGDYASEWGTSQAAPAVTGGLALMVEQYKKQFGGNPKGGLMKAIVMNGGLDLGNTGPDFRHGYGMLNMERNLDMIKNSRFFSGSIATAGVQTQTITVPANTSRLRVMLYWHDPAAAIYANHTLVNDLDLELVNSMGTVIYPQKLDTLPAHVANLPATGADHINNNEQVIINNPSGTYTIRVKGFAVNVNPTQEYFVAYDYLPQGLHLSVPFEKDSYFPGDLCVIHWSDNGTPNNQRTLEYSVNDGVTWATISSTIPDTARYFNWTVPVNWPLPPMPLIETNTARLRITENATAFSAVSGRFTILPVVFHAYAPVAQQCEGYCKIIWSSISASPDIDYEVLMKQGPDMVSKGTTAGTSFTVTGLNKDSVYWFSVRPRKTGVAGKRDNGSPYQPNAGGCTLGISDGDLKLDAILNPNTGRIATLSALSASTNLDIRVKNLDDVSITGFALKYSINGGGFVTIPLGTTIPAGGTFTHTIPGFNFSQPGTYNIVAVVKNNAADPAVANDTLRKTIRQLKNPAISLAIPFIENFDGAPVSEINSNRTGIDSLDSWDFCTTTSNGRVRTFVNTGIARSSNRAMTVDVNKFTGSGSTNYLIGTFNLSGYNAATDEVRFDVQFKHHGTYQAPNADNRIYIRGSETGTWILFYDLDANQPALPGVWKRTASLDIAAALNSASPVQNFSSSTQIRFGQNAIFSMGDNVHYAGYSFDDVRLYTVSNDIEALAITNPQPNSCGLTSMTPVTVLLKNAMGSSIANVPVTMQIDNGTPVTEIVGSVGTSPSGVSYIFTATANLATPGTHTIKIWSSFGMDNFKDNDTVVATIINQPVINTYPYLEDFEANNGNFYSSGLNSSWQYGPPHGIKIKTAASGTKAWKTNLQGWYNDEEISYLYTPCFNVAGLASPTLSFSMAYNIEYCRSADPTAYCDGAWVEYSTDGLSWTKLGSSGSGTNWYNHSVSQLWDSTKAWWHVASIGLPTGATNLRLRFAMTSDVFVGGDGVAIDDIHVYDKQYDIYNANANSNTVSQLVSGSSPINFTDGGKLIATIFPNGNNLGNTGVQAYMYNGATRNTGQQYYANRNITIKPTNIYPGSPVKIRYYFLDKEADSLRQAMGCMGCVNPKDYTKLGIIKYDDTNDNDENGTMADNTDGAYSYLNGMMVKKVPYGAGYYAEYNVAGFSEFWLGYGNSNIILPTEWLSFTAEKLPDTNVLLKWKTTNENDVLQYEVERAVNNSLQANFEKIATVAARNQPGINDYSFTDILPAKQGLYYYRIKRIDRNGQVTYSETRLLLFGKKGFNVLLYPNPVRNKLEVVLQAEVNTTIGLTLYDATGKLLLHQTSSANGTPQKLQVNMAGFASGIYQLKLTMGDSEETMKVVKE
ncbi:MAG: S8 family serine peptidase [Bacteroidota bacterium]